MEFQFDFFFYEYYLNSKILYFNIYKNYQTELLLFYQLKTLWMSQILLSFHVFILLKKIKCTLKFKKFILIFIFYYYKFLINYEHKLFENYNKLT
jgi:hypothetical protein